MTDTGINPNPNASACTVRQLAASELDWANARYAEADFVASSSDDLIVVAEIGGEKAGLGRVVSIDAATGELGGMYVLPAFRGANVARAIVEALIARSTQDVHYCIPFTHLRGFYGGFGFDEVPAGSVVPATVAAKFDWCNRHYPKPVALLVLSRSVLR